MTYHCLLCGEELQERILENRPRLACPHCDWIYYPQLKVSAGVLLEEQGRLLLVQRAFEPWKGCWYLPAGFIEVDEDPLVGAQRETEEETGLLVSITSLRNVSMYQDDPRGNGILIVYDAERASGSLRNSIESTNVDFFSPEEIHGMHLAGSSHSLVIHQWVIEKEGKVPIGS
ncbi:MAG: NUDIX domain-containing protein [Anaerolineaceae bacterium]